MPAEELQLAEERIRRFQKLGGVDLSRADPEDPLRTFVEAGTAEYKKTVFVFKCEMCGNVVRADQDMEPMCTGPSWTDDHPPVVMTLRR